MDILSPRKAPSTSKPDRAITPIENEPSAVTITDIRQWIGTAEEKLEAAYDAAERGEPIDTLLDHINHDVILEACRVIQRDDLTQADAQRVYQKLFPVLACVQGAIKLAEGTVLHTTLEEAFALLDAAQTALDSVNDAVRALPKGGDAHDFQRGRDLAVEMLKQCRGNPSAGECQRRNRDAGARQINVVGDYFVEAMCEQSLFEGFTAVLSGAIGPQVLEPEYFEELTLADTQPGIAGEDGTCWDDEDQAATTAPPEPAGTAADPGERIFEAYWTWSCATEILDHYAANSGSALDFAALELAQGALKKLSAADDNTKALCEEASGAMSSAVAVARACSEVSNDAGSHEALILAGVRKLFEMALSVLDEATLALAENEPNE
ncbi:hypothetical protein DBV14_09630 [Variovorax sp. KBW07]|uniref:hypothetical protein n=1 Tax=Variovorax sp. KBW07 TaxID=2153358 RepID=UPI000F56F55E|nr:hypothetical protein [Variovorax sp. KBW07]RQO57060.1 hypothetical protein DBV14_09630 [Variovorax sp. KBW07]